MLSLKDLEGLKVSSHGREKTIVEIRGVEVGSGEPTIFAGPCSVESYEQLHVIARQVKQYGADVLRGGAFKPRTSPYSFQGLGYYGLELLYEAGQEFDIPVVTEVMSFEDIEDVLKHADCLQVGARNMQNFPLLKALADCHKPVLLKRGASATIQELLLAAEYVLQGNPNVILCERGIRTFETATRNTFDIGGMCLLRELTHLPVIADPSHATGRRSLVAPVALGAIAAGADGLMVEVHNEPEKALSDGAQALLPREFDRLVSSTKKVTRVTSA